MEIRRADPVDRGPKISVRPLRRIVEIFVKTFVEHFTDRSRDCIEIDLCHFVPSDRTDFVKTRTRLESEGVGTPGLYRLQPKLREHSLDPLGGGPMLGPFEAPRYAREGDRAECCHHDEDEQQLEEREPIDRRSAG